MVSRLSLGAAWEPPELRVLRPGAHEAASTGVAPTDAVEPVIAEARAPAQVEAAPSRRLSDREWARAALVEHQAGLLRFAASIVGPEQAQDVVQETFLELCRTERARIEAHLRAWLFKVCRNRALDVHRRTRRFRSLPEIEAAHELRAASQALSRDSGVGAPTVGSAARAAPTSSALEQNPLRLLEHKQARLRIEDWIRSLPPRQREAVVLKFAAELSYKEIAETLETTVSNVGVLLHTALRNLRAIAAPESDPAPKGGSSNGA